MIKMKEKKVCKWFSICPIRRFVEEGKLSKHWIEDYCMGEYKECMRYKLEAKGIPHPDNMLPNGEIKADLK
ncbi:MAG: uracil-DNA glycosylase [Candidatus Korarchaeota archaeon]|nr:uracil-DNA glycosylase [Candidatus Korarchaeota archaeon]